MAYAKCIILGADGELGDAANNLLDNLRDLREQSESSSEGTPFSTDQFDERIRQQLEKVMEAATQDGRRGIHRLLSKRKDAYRDRQ